MKNIILLSVLASVSTLANAVPNIWEHFDTQGYDVYIISSGNGQKLSINCNYANSDNIEHGVYYNINDTDYQNSDSKYPLTFLINDSIVVAPAGSSKWGDGSKSWYKFTSAITKAKKIDVYLNERQVSTIVPKNPTVVKGLAKCKSMADRPKIGV